jgi:hypothetical protein
VLWWTSTNWSTCSALCLLSIFNEENISNTKKIPITPSLYKKIMSRESMDTTKDAQNKKKAEEKEKTPRQSKQGFTIAIAPPFVKSRLRKTSPK